MLRHLHYSLRYPEPDSILTAWTLKEKYDNDHLGFGKVKKC
jgi:hypothetical protein